MESFRQVVEARDLVEDCFWGQNGPVAEVCLDKFENLARDEGLRGL